MPYSEWDEVNDAIQGIEPRVTLAQANVIAEWADAMAAAEDGPENPWAAAIARFKDLYEVEDGRWVKREVEGMEFLSGELSLSEGQPVEFLRVGTFEDMHGHEVEITEDLLDALVETFEAGEAGQEVPVDVQHERGEAAGWIARVWREGDRLLAGVDWNSLGEELVGERVYRYLSATIDLGRKVLKSISLVNFPAVKGLSPVELSEGMYAMASEEGLLDRIVAAVRGVFGDVGAGEGDVDMSSDEEDGMAMTEEQLREQIREEEREKVAAELAERRKREVKLREQIRAEERARLEAQMEARQALVAFAEGLCNGEGAALSKTPEEVVEFLEGLPIEAREGAKAMLEAKVVAFGERGSSGKGAHEDRTVALSDDLQGALRQWIEAGESIEDWFAMNADVLGPMGGYDLSEFEESD